MNIILAIFAFLMALGAFLFKAGNNDARKVIKRINKQNLKLIKKAEESKIERIKADSKNRIKETHEKTKETIEYAANNDDVDAFNDFRE